MTRCAPCGVELCPLLVSDTGIAEVRCDRHILSSTLLRLVRVLSTLIRHIQKVRAADLVPPKRLFLKTGVYAGNVYYRLICAMSLLETS